MKPKKPKAKKSAETQARTKDLKTKPSPKPRMPTADRERHEAHAIYMSLVKSWSKTQKQIVKLMQS